MHRYLLTLVTAAFFAAGADAQTPPARIDELVEKSGMRHQLAQIQPMFDDMLAQQAREANLDGKVVAALRNAFATAYAPERLRANVARDLAVRLADGDVEAALAWLSTDLGRRVTALENEASNADGYAERMHAAARRFASLPAPRRADYDRLVRAIDAVEGTATMTINMLTGLTRGVLIAASGASPPDLESVRAQFEARRGQIVAAIEQAATLSMVAAYGSLSDQELARYIAFAESPAGRRYHAATLRALDRAMTDAAIEAGRLIASKSA